MPVTHTVKSGECLISIASQYGFSDWKKIYEHEDNEQLRTRRPNPNILLVGDEVIIPDVKTKSEPVEPDTVNTFVVKGVKQNIKLKLVEHIRGEPLKNCDYELTYSDNKSGNDKVKEGVLDSEGKLCVKVPSHITNASLTVKAHDTEYVWELSIGSPNPPETKSSVAQQLMNTGYLDSCSEDKLAKMLVDNGVAVSDLIADAWRSFTASANNIVKSFDNWSPWLSNDRQGNHSSDEEMAVTGNTEDSSLSAVAGETISQLKKIFK